MNLVDLLREHSVPHRTEGHEHCRPGWVQVDCPLCSPGWGHWRAGINLSGRYANCWSCGRLSLAKLFADLTRLPYGQAQSLVGSTQADRRYDEYKVRGTYREPEGVGRLLKSHRLYLQQRGFDPDELERLWEVKGIGIASKLSWRLFIPLRFRGETVSWTTRTLSPTRTPRYISAAPNQESIDAKLLLGGEDYCRHAIVVCEGPLDAMAIGPGAIWTGGTAYSRAQMVRVSRYPVRVVCYDATPEGQAKARKLVAELSVMPGETYNVELETGKDPAECGKKEVRELRRKFLE